MANTSCVTGEGTIGFTIVNSLNVPLSIILYDRQEDAVEHCRKLRETYQNDNIFYFIHALVHAPVFDLRAARV